MIKSRRFHVFTPCTGDDLGYAPISAAGSALKGAYVDFIEEFGWAMLYNEKREGPLVSAYPLIEHRRMFLGDGLPYIGFGYSGMRSAFFQEALILRDGCSPVFGELNGKVILFADTFDIWLKSSCDWAKSTFKPAVWSRIVKGPKPFTAKEQAIVAARALFTWKHVGFAANGDSIFEVHNGSTLSLPYLSIGVQGKGGSILVGGAWLSVSAIKPGQTNQVIHSCYKEMMKLEEHEFFHKLEPIPEQREAYWEFKKLPT